MKVTQLGRATVAGGSAAFSATGGEVTGTNPNFGPGGLPPSGQIPTANGSNGWAWGSNVATAWANGSNQIMGPAINFASGSNMIFSVSSNTLTIHGQAGGGGGGGGIAGITVQEEGTPLATLATAVNFVGGGVTASGAGATKTITIPGSSGAGLPDPFGDPNFTDASLAGWTTRGAFTTIDANTTVPNCLYIKGGTAGSGTDDVQGLYRPWTPSAGDWVQAKFLGHRMIATFQEVGIFVAETVPGKVAGFNMYMDGGVHPSLHWRDWSSPTNNVNDSNLAINGPIGAGAYVGHFGAFWLRIVWNSNTDLDYLFSYDGFRWEVGTSAHAPSSAFTTGSWGIYVFPYGTATANEVTVSRWEEGP